jgi:hypothetical protein
MRLQLSVALPDYPLVILRLTKVCIIPKIVLKSCMHENSMTRVQRCVDTPWPVHGYNSRYEAGERRDDHRGTLPSALIRGQRPITRIPY